MTETEAKAIVRKRFPRAYVGRVERTYYGEPTEFACYRDPDENYTRICSGYTKRDAWIEAAEMIETSADHDTKGAIIVWRFEDAPQAYRELSTNGGDEDWLAFLPHAMSMPWVQWLQVGAFGNDVDEIPVKHGTIFISSHA